MVPLTDAGPGQVSVVSGQQTWKKNNLVNFFSCFLNSEDFFFFQIAVSIMQGVSAQFPCTWEEVLDFRRDHVGPPEQAVRALVYMKNQLQYQLQHQTQHLPYGHVTPNQGGFTLQVERRLFHITLSR